MYCVEVHMITRLLAPSSELTSSEHDVGVVAFPGPVMINLPLIYLVLHGVGASIHHYKIL